MLKNQRGALPKDPIGVKFCQIFTHGWNFIQAKLDSLGYLARSWTTETRYPIQPRNLWNKFKDPNQIVGLRFGSSTNYLVLDIDRHSIYHPKRSLKKYKEILHALEDVGLVRYIVIQSSYSEGIHIYFFLPEKVSTFKLAVAVQNALEDNGYYVKKGQLEIFPNVKAYNKKCPTNYNGIRLPLQPNTGSFILDDDSLAPISDSIEEFLNMAESTAQQQDLETLKEAIASAKKKHKPRFVSNGASQNKVPEWEKDLLARINEGWTAKGQTNDLLKDIACHGVVFKGFEGDPLTRYIYETAIHSPGYRRWCRHQHEIHKRCQEWARCAEKYWTCLYSRPSRYETYRKMWDKQTANKNNNVNEKRHTEALERTRQAVDWIIKTLGELPKLVEERIKAICKAAKELTNKTISRKTLYKNEFKEIWHPAYLNSDSTEVTEKKASDNNNSESFYTSDVVCENQKEEKEAKCPAEKDSPTPRPIYEGFVGISKPLEAPQGRREGLEISINRGVRGDDSSRATSEKSKNEPVSPEFAENVPRKEKDRLNGQETPAEGKKSEELHQDKNSSLAAGNCSQSDRPDPNNQQSSLPYPNFFQVLKLRIELTVKARKMAELEAAERGIKSKDSIEAIKRRILNELFRESGEPVLIAEVEKWEDENF